MAFTLTKEHVRDIMDSINEGNWDSFLATVDRNVKWIVGDPLHDPKSLTGTYNLQSYVQKVVTPLFSRLESSTKMTIEELDVIGQKAFVETSGVATQKNGKPYNNKYCWILIFSKNTSKIIEVREYSNTALMQEVIESNEGA